MKLRNGILRFGRTLLVGMAVAGFCVYQSRNMPEEPQAPILIRKASRSAAPASARSESDEGSSSPLTLLPPAEEGPAARSMDETGVRFSLQQLRLAAVSRDFVTVAATQDMLRRYGRSADSFLREGLAQESDPCVREVLSATRSLLR